MRIYADTSFLLSLYSLDGNSAAAAHTMGAFAGERFISILGELEVVNALGLRVFSNEITMAQAQSSLSDFEKDLRDGVTHGFGAIEAKSELQTLIEVFLRFGVFGSYRVIRMPKIGEEQGSDVGRRGVLRANTDGG